MSVHQKWDKSEQKQFSISGVFPGFVAGVCGVSLSLSNSWHPPHIWVPHLPFKEILIVLFGSYGCSLECFLSLHQCCEQPVDFPSHNLTLDLKVLWKQPSRGSFQKHGDLWPDLLLCCSADRSVTQWMSRVEHTKTNPFSVYAGWTFCNTWKC